eukprot:s225_g23.t1
MGKRGSEAVAPAQKKAAKAAAKGAAAAPAGSSAQEALTLTLPPQQTSVNCQAMTLNGKIWTIKYMCLINLLWLNQTWSPTPQIPINKGAVTVGILKQELDSKSFPAFRTWKRVSAQESSLAFFETASSEASKDADGFLHHASVVMDRALRHRQVLEVILSEEGSGLSIWDSVSKLHAGCNKSTRQEEVAWMFQHMHDSKLAGLLDPNQSVRFFTGEGRPVAKDVVFGTTFDENLRAAVIAGKSPLDAMSMETKLGERYSAFKTLPRAELDTAKAEASAALRAQSQGEAAEAVPDESGEKERTAAFKACLDDVQARIGEVKNEDLLESIQFYEEKARNLLSSNMQLFIFPNSEKELCELLDKTAAAQTRGSSKSFVGIIFDPAQWGESITNPHVRVCPLNMQYLRTFLSAVIKNRDNQQVSIHSRDLFICFDSFLPGNLPKWLGAFQTASGDAITKQSFQVYISYDEDSLRLRRRYIKASTTTFQQIEQMSLVTAENFGDCMTKKNRKHFKGSNFGNKIGDVLLNTPQALWSMTLKDTKG